MSACAHSHLLDRLETHPLDGAEGKASPVRDSGGSLTEKPFLTSHAHRERMAV
jgi:hypothetical protein